MATIKDLNAHDRPPEKVRATYKKYQRVRLSEIDHDPDIIDLEKLDQDNLSDPFILLESLSSEDLREAFDEFMGKGHSSHGTHGTALIEDVPVIAHKRVSGLRMIPSLIPPTIQSKLLSLMLHRDLSDPSHQTNLHLHYDIQYPNASNHISGADGAEETSPSYASFFEADPSLVLTAKDPNIHKAITVQNMLEKKLRWVTLGGQYNWTTKVYPDGPPPAFPEDIARLLGAAFPETEAQAAIVNFYSANDTLSMHRDVSEKCDIGLISVSIGCDGLFMISYDDGEGCEVIRLRSGDAVYMSGRSRFAWHGVPKIIPETCPTWLRDWPGPEYPFWQGWMSGKRVNLNVRQMTDAKSNQDAAIAA